MTKPMSRRTILGLAIGTFGLASPPNARGQTPAFIVYKDPSCGCCNGWVAHLKQAGYSGSVEEPAELSVIKRQLGIPPELWSCHTATAAGYVMEGHVPAHALARLFADRPPIAGIAVPGMPMGSPGMEGDRWEVYEVIGFDGSRRIQFGRYRGMTAV